MIRLLVVVVILLGGCASPPLPSDTIDGPPDLSKGSPAPTAISEAAIQEWIEFRKSFGLRSDREWVLEVARAPASSNDSGVPMLPTEITAYGALVTDLGDVLQVLRRYGEAHQESFAGVYADGKTGVLAMTSDVDQHLEALGALIPEGLAFDVRPARWSLIELKAFEAQIHADSGWFAEVNAELNGINIRETDNQVEIEYLGNDEAPEPLIREHFGDPQWLVVTRFGPLPWSGQRGELVITVTDAAGRPIRDVQCEPTSVDPKAVFEDAIGYVTDERGMCVFQGLPATGYIVRVWMETESGRVEKTARTTVIGHRRTTVRLILD